MYYQKDRLINVTTQISPDGHGWQLEVEFPPHVRSRDKKKMIGWLKKYEETLKSKAPDVHVTVYHHPPKSVLVATPQSTDKDYSIADHARARMGHMFNILGLYDEGQAHITP